MLDRFDEVLEEVIELYNLHDGPQLIPFGRKYLLSKRSNQEDELAMTSELDKLGYGTDGDRQLVENILKFSRRLMDNCGNRSLYNSSERLNDLLHTTSLPLLLEILRLASRLALRYNFSRVRSAVPNLISQSLLHSHYNINLEHVQRLAEPFSRLSQGTSVSSVQDPKSKGKERAMNEPQGQQSILEPNDFVELLRETIDEKAFAEYTSVSFRFYQQVPPSTDAEVRESIPIDRSGIPNIPTPVRRPSGLSRQQKPQEGESSSSLEKTSPTPAVSTESGQRTITIDSATLRSQSLEEVLTQYLPQLPKVTHFDFLARLQIAKALVSGREARLNVVELRLLAIMNLAYIYPERDFQNKLLAYDSDEPRRLQIVNQLAEIIRPFASGQPKIRISLKTTAISTLEALSKHKTRFGDVCAGLQINVNHGIIFQILHEAIGELAQDKGNEYDEMEEDWRDALLSLLEILPSIGANARTAETLIGAGFFDILVKELALRSAKAERVHYKILMFVITMSHMVRDALQTFSNSKGFEVVSDLLAYEVRSAIEDVEAGNKIPAAHRSQIMDYQMSFFKQQTLRWLFKFINSMLSQQGGNVERLIRNLIDSPQLLTALREVMENAKIFGANTWSGAINVLSSFIHNEPTSYAIIVEAGLSKTLLECISQETLPEDVSIATSTDLMIDLSKVLKCAPDMIMVFDKSTTGSLGNTQHINLKRPADKVLAAGILPANEPIVQIPHALGALCLNPSGQDLFLKSNVLNVYLEIFESPAHVKILSADVSAAKLLGTTFEELMRHHPRLKHTIILAIIISLARVSYLCSQLASTELDGARLLLDHKSTIVASQNINGNIGTFGPSTSDSSDHNKANKDDLTACDYLSVMVNFLQGFCENATACTSLIRAGAVEFLLDLATSPSLPYNFNSRSESLELARVIHSLVDNKTHLVLPAVLIRMEASISKFEAFTEFDQPQSFFLTHLGMPTEGSTAESCLAILRALVEVHTLSNILQESLANSTLSTSRNSQSPFVQVNLADHWIKIVEGLLKIQPSCIWEEILLLKSLPESLKESNFVDGLRTGVEEADRTFSNQEVNEVSTIVDQSSSSHTNNNNDHIQVGPSNEKKQQLRSEHVPALRYLLSQVPLTITPFLQSLAKALVTKRKQDHYVRQNAYKVAGFIVRCFMKQLDNKRVLRADDLKDRYNYFMVILTGFSHLTMDSSPERNYMQCMTLLLVVFKRQEDGLSKMNNLLHMFLDYIKYKTGEDKELLACAFAGMQIILAFYTQLVSARYIIESLQSQAMQGSGGDRDREGYYYFSATQLLVDFRVKILSAIKPIWDSTVAERVSTASIKRMMDIFRKVFESDNENGARKQADGQAMICYPEFRLCNINQERLTALEARGASEDLAREACFRLVNNAGAAEEYCDMHLREMGVLRLPPPENEIRRDPANTMATATFDDARPSSETTISEPSTESSPANPAHATMTPANGNSTETAESLLPLTIPLPTSTSMEIDTNLTGQDDDDDENGMAMSIGNQLNLSEPTAPDPPVPSSRHDPQNTILGPRPSLRSEKLPAPDIATVDELNELRESLRRELVDRVLDMMAAHEGLTFDLADLIISAIKTASFADDMRRDVCTTLVESLVSFTDSDLIANGKKIADHANLLAVVLQDDEFYQAAGSELREYFSSLTGFINIPTDDEKSTTSYPWISQVLVLMEKILAEDVMPLTVDWTAPIADADGNYELTADHTVQLKIEDPQISLDDRRQLFDAILNILPQVGKDAYLGLSIVRILVILTRSREIADELSKKHNLHRLFLMAKQLAGIFDLEFQKTFMVVLRHIIEDEDIIRKVMRAEIKALWNSGRSSSRTHDLSSYTKAMAHLIIRGPEIFVSVTEELVEITGEHGGRNGQYPLILKKPKASEIEDSGEITRSHDPNTASVEVKPSPEENADTRAADDKVQISEIKIPPQEKPDGVTHWLLSQLLTYKDVEDKDSSLLISGDVSTGANGSKNPDAVKQTNESGAAKSSSEKRIDKSEWVGEQHPHFHYRCFLLEALTELLESYQSAKVEFVNFKQEPKTTTPSKPRPAMLNYLLTRLIPVGTLVKVDSVAMKKKDAQSQWAISLIVALCLQPNHVDLSKHNNTTRDTENDLTYIRKFVLESSYKTFKDAAAIDEPLDSKYGRLLNLADLFCRLLLGRAMPKNFYNSGSTATVQKGLAKIMFEKNYIAMLTGAIADLDLNFPNSRRAVKYILRPLKLLTETAIELSQNAEILIAPGTTEIDTISLATSVSDVDMDREETPDLFRNSTLGILEPSRDEDSSSESEDGEEEIYETGYDDEMDFEEERDRDDDEVVSDEDEELDDAIPIEGLSGDHPMDVEVIIDGDDDDSDGDDTEDDSEDDDMEDGDELETFEEIDGDDEVLSGDGTGEDEWEDEDRDDDDDEDDDDDDENSREPSHTLQEALDQERNAAITAIIGQDIDELDTMDEVLDHMADAGREESAVPSEMFNLGTGTLGEHLHPMEQFDFGEMPTFNPAAMHDDDDNDDDDEDDDGEDEDVEPDYEDEGDAPPWGWDGGDEVGAIPPPRHHHHHHHHHWAGGRRNPWTMFQHDEARGVVVPAYRQHGRSGPDAHPNSAIHPLLLRTPSASQRPLTHPRDLSSHYTEFLNLLSRDRRSGSAMNLINSMIGAMGAGGVIDLAGSGGTLHVQIGGRDGAAVLPFPNGDMMRMMGHPIRPQILSNRQSRHYDHSLIARFVPAPTTQRWRFEAMMLCGGDEYLNRAQAITKAIEKVLVPASLEETKIRLAEERKAIEEERTKRELEKKGEEENLAKEKIEKEAQEQREREEKEAADLQAAAQVTEAGETSATPDAGAMEGVETTIAVDIAEAVTAQAEAPTEPEQIPIIATFRGREVDISGLGIDLEYLDALPDDLREEVLMQQLAEQRSQAVATGQDGDDISPEFLAALPEDIRQELLQQESRDRRRRERAQAPLRAQGDGQATRAEEMDPASFFASLDPTLRASVLVEQGEDILDQLPPAIAAEARALGADRVRFLNETRRSRSSHRIGTDRRHVQDNTDNSIVKKSERQVVQMLDKPGVATLLRLLFVSQQGNGKDILNDILRNVSLNRQNRAEVIGLLLCVLQEGSLDAAAVERSFAQLSARAKQISSIQKSPLKRTNTGSLHGSLILDMSPATIIQQCLSTLVFLTRENMHVPSFFLTENEGFAKSKAVRKGKGKDTRASKFALNSLLSLLDRPIILDSAGCMEQLSTLLQHITHRLTLLTKKDRKAIKTDGEETKSGETAEETAPTTSITNTVQASGDSQTVQDAEAGSSDPPADDNLDASAATNAEGPSDMAKIEENSKKQRNLVPPVIPEENLHLVVSILAARECSAKTFRDTLSTISNLSAIPGAKETFGKELINQAQRLGRLVSEELDALIPQIENAIDSTDAQGVPSMTKFAAPAADQAKLLRVLTALDYLFVPKRHANSEDAKASSSILREDTLAALYESASFGPLWQKLSQCLAAMKDKNYAHNVATILLPLIESLMVICTNTTIKETPTKPAKEFSVASPEPESLAENLFFRFTEDHRKILNELVRHNPRLMSGTFSLLVKNSKVLEFDNKRNYFTRRLHARGDQRRSQPPLNLPIRRDRTFLDSFQALYYKLPDEIKYGKLNIRFHGEEGVDAGGVTREWFQVMSRQMFNPDYALFSPVAADRTTFHPNKSSGIQGPHLMWFKFIGRIIGKALYEGRALDCHFSRAVYKKILGKSVSVKDMESLDLEYSKSLVWMLENDITELIDQTFSVEAEAFGLTEVVDLMPDGRNIPVTEENKQEYVQLIVEYRLIGSVKEQLEHFLKGEFGSPMLNFFYANECRLP